ncbi:50S ribosomal protein L23 [Candidatus Marsarchaeota G2 archaeon ECH_B_SAG-F08]|jgi:large subunit ribosomal protein L23|uniref:Large ribosomal subunit protein uL23 n=4 Tax=Candidatus Marsarchaeota TaxID=1978152 RepID=A0A2R6AK95_9ARCH|nr:MAG: 50S ribosomal protein L23 [Candidatus Marsarchaeota G1 archaeon BE_D]PSN88886.1 MAG: 50S ribosomal protein L23 [Candidatus Marsarchaeota G1 archaeon OSP_C]PSN93328.1 MAG: 50S ribosomal protein L23 [Candidatus Marsarchaeota G1 archaeon OSP_B]PSN97518.1 MAG: 50S ribosomal protein L23 [Candidatus Marsarchaeota G2 archaeon ECH_B_SAG-F08]
MSETKNTNLNKSIGLSNVLIRPWVTEKTTGLIEKQNTLVFEVARNATKSEIKKAVEYQFGVKVMKVRTVNTPTNRKKAYVRLSPQYKAQEIATRLGIL